jgi:hypothetical protein
VCGQYGCEKAADEEYNAELGHDFYDLIGLNDILLSKPFPCHGWDSPFH